MIQKITSPPSASRPVSPATLLFSPEKVQMVAAGPTILPRLAGATRFSSSLSVPAFFAPRAAYGKGGLSCCSTAANSAGRRRTWQERGRVGCRCLRSDGEMAAGETGVEEGREQEGGEVCLNSVSPVPLLLFAVLPGAETIKSLFAPFVDIVKMWNLPDWLVHWGHPGNMAVVLFAMGGYGTYLGFRIRFSDDVNEKAKAKDLHPKLLAGMFFFFALGATGGITSLLTSDKHILESPHAVTGIIGLTLLTIQSILPTLFEGNPGLRNVHGILGSGIMTLFLIHAAFGLQLGLSY